MIQLPQVCLKINTGRPISEILKLTRITSLSCSNIAQAYSHSSAVKSGLNTLLLSTDIARKSKWGQRGMAMVNHKLG